MLDIMSEYSKFSKNIWVPSGDINDIEIENAKKEKATYC